MYYELYVDSLFVVNFVMNLYLLILVNQSLLRTATRKRLFGGACLGALCYLLPFMIPLPVWVKYPVGLFVGTWLMIYVTFRPGGIQGYFKVLKCLLGYSFLLGGLLLFVKSLLPEACGIWAGVGAVCGVGTIAVIAVAFLQKKNAQKSLESNCKVTLINGERRLTIQALIDSGNGLIEPISGKPVSIIQRKVYEALWTREPLFRAVPYHSIGCKNGILKGYLLPILRIEIEGLTKDFQEVYVAVSEESGNVPMIINPALFKES